MKGEEADLARDIEKRLLSLPLDSGILFVGVSVDPEEYDVGTRKRTPAVYRIWVGCHRNFDTRTMDALVRHVLKEEIDKGLQVQIQAHRGLGRSFLEKR